MGVIDKVLYKEEDTTYLVVDYKTGSTNINLKNMEYGLGLQLPISIFVKQNGIKNIKVVGFYLQKLFTSTLDNRKTMKPLEKIILDQKDILPIMRIFYLSFDTTYNDSKLIKGMKKQLVKDLVHIVKY